MTEPRSNEEIRAGAVSLADCCERAGGFCGQGLLTEVDTLLAALAAERARADQADKALTKVRAALRGVADIANERLVELAAERVKVAAVKNLAENLHTESLKAEAFAEAQLRDRGDKLGARHLLGRSSGLAEAEIRVRSALVGGSTEGDTDA